MCVNSNRDGPVCLLSQAVLNFQIRMQLRILRADDFLILKEGIETMSVSALQDACRARGMRAAGISEEGLRERLSQWIKLHIIEDVPASLLLMSRVLYLPENLAPEAQLATVLDSLPENIKDEVKVAAAESEAIEVEPEAGENACRSYLCLRTWGGGGGGARTPFFIMEVAAPRWS